MMAKKKKKRKKNKMPPLFAELLTDYQNMFGVENVYYLYDEQKNEWKVFCNENIDTLK
tara:strand:- start:261 stop:434 length:174 start_codon:yes stop_codon:yes gene_type:complete